jgi:hypothetical protein
MHGSIRAREAFCPAHRSSLSLQAVLHMTRFSYSPKRPRDDCQVPCGKVVKCEDGYCMLRTGRALRSFGAAAGQRGLDVRYVTGASFIELR